MQTPTHWKEYNLLSIILLPLDWLYAFATALRFVFNKAQKINTPIICIGNLTAGGTGKTPVAISIAKILQKKDKNPFFITRGYGGTISDIIVDKKIHNAEMVGDEPLLLSNQAPVVVNHKRIDAALKAENSGAKSIIMDDGFQNPALFKDLSFIVIDGEYGLGNNLCIPAGPLREFVSLGIKRANAVIILGEDNFDLKTRFSKLPVFMGKVSPIMPDITNKRVIAFAGIGRPAKFYNSLEEVGFKIVQSFDFPDHHYYNKKELQKIIVLANKTKSEIFTTSKDFVKIPINMQVYFNVLDIEIKWEDEKKLADFLNI